MASGNSTSGHASQAEAPPVEAQLIDALLVDAMSRPEFYPNSPPRIELKQTHISRVFIAGEVVYKIKKPVRFPFLDCSRLAQRFRYCCEEVRLNARLAPRVYLGVFAILQNGRGFALGPQVHAEHPGAVEYAVKMRRLPDDRMLDAMLAADRVDCTTMRTIAARLADFHASASSAKGWVHGSAASIWRHVTGELAENEAFVGGTLTHEQFAAIDGFCRAFVPAHWRQLNDRAREGSVREGHGDLRAEHICIADGDEIEVIDCVEFSERLRCGDVASELAFLAMDLERLGAPALAEQLIDDYSKITGDAELVELVPFYKCYRACVRGKVESLKSLEREVGSAEARRAGDLSRSYFTLASRYARESSPALLVVCGLSGTGKSTVARMLQHRCGFRAISSDRVRKRLANVSASQRIRADYGTDIYSDQFSRLTYEAMLAEAEGLLREGRGAILDATFKSCADRRLALALAQRCGVPVLFVECVVSEEEAMRRLKRRESIPGEVSDATAAVYEKQRVEFEPIREIAAAQHLAIDTARPREEILAEIGNALAGLPRAS